MSRESALIKNTCILALGNYLPKLTTIITLPILTGHLSKAEYGSYDLITTLVSLLLPAMTLQIQSAAFRFLISFRDNREKIVSVITNIFIFTIPISVIGLIGTYFALGESIDISTKSIILSYFFCDIIYIGCGQITRGLGKNTIYATAAVIVSIINMAGICLSVLVFHAGLNGILLGMTLACAVGSIMMVYRVCLLSYFSVGAISLRKIKELLVYSWPMVPNALSNWVLSLSDRFVILRFLGVESNAIYSVANKIPNLVKTFQGTFVSSWQENASLSVEDEDAENYYSKMLDCVNRIVVGLAAGLIAITPIIFSILIRGDYDEAYQQMSFLYIGMYFSCMSSFLGGIYIAHMKTISVGLTTLAAAVCNLMINLLAIQHIGLYAASISTLISYALLFMFRLLDIKKIQKIQTNFVKLVLFLVVLIFMSIVVYVRKPILNIVNMFFGLSFAVTINRKMVMAILKSVLGKFSRKR